MEAAVILTLIMFASVAAFAAWCVTGGFTQRRLYAELEEMQARANRAWEARQALEEAETLAPCCEAIR